MKNQFLKIIRSIYLLSIACLAWTLKAVHLLCSRASYHLTRRLVDKETRDIFDGKKYQAAEVNMTDYRQKLIDLLNGESEVIVGFVREAIEKTKPGQLAVRHALDRHPYAVMVPNKQENITRILNAFNAFPKAAAENAYKVLSRAIQDFHCPPGESENEETTV
ncbi:MAG: hypothetical protein H8E62_03370 [Planctomycetes bacterium]|nr:hypothetical protein [Planctomycetota bacterium]